MFEGTHKGEGKMCGAQAKSQELRVVLNFEVKNHDTAKGNEKSAKETHVPKSPHCTREQEAKSFVPCSQSK